MGGTVQLTRRRFLQVMAGTAGALIVGVGTASAADQPLPLSMLGDTVTRLGAYLRIDVDGRVVIGARDPDNGEGTLTSLPRIIADEMDADWNRVVVEPLGLGVEEGNGEPRWIYGRQQSGDASSMPAAWADLRQAGALARWLLRDAAARRFGLPAEQLRSEAGVVIAPDGRRLGYGELAAAAAQLQPPGSAPAVKTPDHYRLIGQPVGDVDAHAVVTGHLEYAIDRAPAGALIAVLSRCPWPNGSLESVDTAEALKVPGVVQVVQIQPEKGQLLGTTALAPAVAVLAESTWAALQGRAKLKLGWKPDERKEVNSSVLEQQAIALFEGDAAATATVRNDGDIVLAKKKAARTLEATYYQPWAAHATAEPMNCTVRIDPGNSAVVELSTQAPRQAYAVVQRLTGLKATQIDIRVTRGGGAFGRRMDHDYVAEAVMIALADKPDGMKNRPVKLLWTRDEDLTHDVYRPLAVHRITASIDGRKRITGWNQRMASPSAQWRRGVPDNRLWTSELVADQLPAGLVPNFRSDWYGLDSILPRGEWRGTPHVSNAFAVESFIDEIAHSLKQNPLDFRLQLLGEARQMPYQGRGGPTIDIGRLINVLKLVADRIDWKNWLRTENGLGIACHYAFGGYVAHAVEVSAKDGLINIERAVCAVDVGRVINPRGLEAQVMGATMDALSTAMNLAITIKDGQVQQRNFHDYPISAAEPLPNDVEVILVDSQLDPAGASVLGMPTAAPALANAVFRATAVRVRRLPLVRELARLS
jgi:isoquinoline 1-oxidoreductase subunit beta